jgi:hypothetical protein
MAQRLATQPRNRKISLLMPLRPHRSLDGQRRDANPVLGTVVHSTPSTATPTWRSFSTTGWS